MLFPFQFGIKEIIDILLVTCIIYGCFRLLRKSSAVNLFWGIALFVLFWFLVSVVFRLELTGALVDRILAVGAIALIVIFQNEIRTLFYRLGSRFSHSIWRHVREQNTKSEKVIQQIVLACQHLSNTKTGALIVFATIGDLKEYADTGTEINADVSAPLLENIFFKNTPLHDGAVLITENQIHAAACILPVSKSVDLPLQYGLRHRAALGLSEKDSSVLIIVVSEETGHIAVVQQGKIQTVTNEELLQMLYLKIAN